MKITVTGSQHDRHPADPAPACPPADVAAWEALRMMPEDALRELGLRRWCDPAAPTWPLHQTLMLLPGEWYSHIPDGFELVTINAAPRVFKRGVTDDDVRMGCLAYGILVGPASD